MATELAKVYDPKSVEAEISRRWLEAGAFNADPADEREKYCIVIPPPNVTAALHLGHALNNTLQDVLIRFKRMSQFNTLWMPGTDHAGIATQTVVEKRILAEEGKRRTDFDRSEFVARIQAWKDEYEVRILGQLKMMGCSCDWRRTRFTMDETCAAAVRETFFRLFSDGLIYRGKRLVNWDVATQTVLADDEVEHEEVQGHFWYLRYPLEEPVVCDESVPCVEGVSPSCSEGILPSGGESQDADIIKRKGHYLPHWTRTGAIYAVTFRLADSVPQEASEAWRKERQDVLARAATQNRDLTYQEKVELNRLFSARVESFLDAGRGCCLMNDNRVAEIVLNAMKHFDGDRYNLIAWAVMPNHVHVVLRPFDGQQLDKILHSWKSFTAKEINHVLESRGQVWMDDYYDHLIRDESDYHSQVNYVLANPEKAGLRNWPWSGVGSSIETADRGQDALGTRGRDALDTLITHVTVATTRPETMLGDTAVAMNPADPRAKFLVGKKVRLPIVGRLIPIIADEHVVLPDPNSEDEKARFSTGFLKVTPAHDPDDYAIGQRHGLAMINVMAPDGSISDKHGWEDAGPDAQFLLGMDRFEARAAIEEWFRSENLLVEKRPYTHQVGHSYRSHVPIEPYLSDQWYVEVKKPFPCFKLAIAYWQERGLVEQRDGVTYAAGTDVPVNSLAGLALMPLLEGRLKFTPERYANNYRSWLENLRDWPISRQLWWGHQIPVWKRVSGDRDVSGTLSEDSAHDGETSMEIQGVKVPCQTGWDAGREYLFCCVPPGHPEVETVLERLGWVRDCDVLDTWFSSALWPFSTLGWPKETPELKKYYPGDLLCTAREIITLWVTRMVMMGQYCLGEIPFTDVFIHAMIQDGEGRKMSKSLGNGIDPLDIIDSHGADAMRFTLVSMTTQTQDVRMPVEEMKLPDGRVVNTSPKIDIGRNFCNKLWNAARFLMMNIQGQPAWGEIRASENLADAWILSRLNATIRDVTLAMEGYRFNEIADTLYRFMWNDFCDWYLEIAKSRINAGAAAPKAILSHCLDVLLRLLHPVAPFITEEIWRNLNEISPLRGPSDERAEPLLVTACWPYANAGAISEPIEREFALLQNLISQIRNVRTRHNVLPGKKVSVVIEAPGHLASVIAGNTDLLKSLASLSEVIVSREPLASLPANAAVVSVSGVRLFVLDTIDRDAELARLTKQAETLRRGIGGIEGKLNSAGFIVKAPPDLVQRERERLDQLRADLAAVEQSLATLK